MAMMQMMRWCQIAGTESALSRRPTPTASRIDGRRLRSERTRQLIIEAYLALVREKRRRCRPRRRSPSGRAIRCARCSSAFPTFTALHVAATDHALVQVAALAPARDLDGDRQTRIRTQVEKRGRTCERWLPLWRALVINQGESAELKQRVIGCARTDLSAAWS